MPEAIVAIIIIGIIAGTVLGLTGMILQHRRSTRAMGSGESGNEGIRTSELKQMMREAAAEAVAPLEARMDELQLLLEEEPQKARALPAAREQELIDVDEEDSGVAVRVRQKVR